MVYTVLPPWWCSRRTFGRSRERRGLGELGLRQGATEREEERCEEKRGSGMAFYSRSAGAPREVCTASMAEFPRRHWPAWRCRRLTSCYRSSEASLLASGRQLERGRRREDLEIQGGGWPSARCSTKCQPQDEDFGLAFHGIHASYGDGREVQR